MTNRGVSVTVNFALSLVVATMLLSTLMFATGTLLETQQDRTVRTELRVVGERLAASLMTADRLAEAGGSEVVIRTEAPPRVGGTGYEVEINATSSNSELVLKPEDKFSTVYVDFVNTTSVNSRSVDGGDFQVVLTDGGSLEVQSDVD